ncbi:MAG: hypothetical protein CTY16_03090 [Methylobacter sp.]|nr:MAG: hypothetical protein CTY16_03090 [Methylobacter sp.]
MTSENNLERFKNAIGKALDEFEHRLEQQRLFQVQNTLLKTLQQEIVKTDYCSSETIKDLSTQYEDFYIRLSETGRSYENIVTEKSLVDAYSAFEKLLFDCFCSLYEFFPKFLGTEVKVNTIDFFIDGNMDICRKNIIELHVKSFIQANHIKIIIDGFKKQFDIKAIDINENDMNLLHEISLVRNLIIHNNSIVNRTYKESIKKFLKNKEKYFFNEEDTVLHKLELLLEDIKELSEKISTQIAEAILNDAERLYLHHENK